MLSEGPDPGYFPRESSILRRVHEERAVGLFFGQRALCIGALNPVAFTGTIDHTAGRMRPFKRLAHTGLMFEEIWFGTKAEADAALAFVERLHRRVSGRLEADAGTYPAGTPYTAFDPELMFWTLAVIAESGQYFYELFVRPLRPAEREQLYREYVRFGELFGMPRDAAPPTYAEFRRWWDDELASDRVHLTADGREIGYMTAFEIPFPRSRQPAKRLHDLIMLGSLPPRVRSLYDLRWTPAHAVAFRAAVTALRSARPLAPNSIRRGRSGGEYELIAHTENQRIERGEYTPQATATAA